MCYARIVNQSVKKRRRYRINPKTATTILPLKSGRFFWSKTFLSLQNAVFLVRFGILLQSHSRILFFAWAKGILWMVAGAIPGDHRSAGN